MRNCKINLSKSIQIIFILLVAPVFQLKAEVKRDTLIQKAWRDTVRIQKAQVFETNNAAMVYCRPKPFQFAKYIPSDIYQTGKTALSKKNLPKLGIILAGSALLMTVDQPVTDAARQFGRFIRLNSNRRSKTVIQFDIGSFQSMPWKYLII